MRYNLFPTREVCLSTSSLTHLLMAVSLQADQILTSTLHAFFSECLHIVNGQLSVEDAWGACSERVKCMRGNGSAVQVAHKGSGPQAQVPGLSCTRHCIYLECAVYEGSNLKVL